ncbi:flagellar protein [Ferrigenium kumadai]|uniref:Flagellar protein n=1 Tax=Ferrigenium kumadai TaxID=1682490 RepID=A0AAN1SXS3_9PROT|nr:flagellar protein FlaG [Ferrigenium kumadai]BBI98787.1 flagellar protein [Ferrigenium kumadai]
MLIQNVSNMAQAPQPARLASDGGPVAVVAAPSNVQTPPAVSLELPQTAVTPVADQQATAAQLQNVVDGINKALKQSNKNLEFSIDSDTNRSIVKLVDSETGDVIRQFPSEEALAISKSIDRIQQGLLLKQQA